MGASAQIRWQNLIRRAAMPYEVGTKSFGASTGYDPGDGLAAYFEKTGLGPFETTHVEVRPDGQLTVDSGASSMGSGPEPVLTQIGGHALGLPASPGAGLVLRSDLLGSKGAPCRHVPLDMLEAVRHEITRRRREGLLGSLRHPHPETAELAELGLGEWARQRPAEDGAALVDLQVGKPIRWMPDQGWVEADE